MPRYVYNPVTLKRIERQSYRNKRMQVPFTGCDVVNCYSFSFLTKNNIPVNRLLKIVYPSDSRYTVTSKSLQSYLNGFSMSTQGSTVELSIARVRSLIERDLKGLLEVEVEIQFFDNRVPNIKRVFSGYPLIAPGSNTTVTVFRETSKLLKMKEGGRGMFKLSSDLLSFKYKGTQQINWGDVFIYFEGDEQPTLNSLVKYLISFREDHRYPEEVVEMIYKRLYQKFTPDKLMVSAIFTRQDGVDICPCRSTHPELLDEDFINVNVLCRKRLRQ